MLAHPILDCASVLLAVRAVAAAQLHQVCINAARVLAVVGSALPLALALLVYVSEDALICTGIRDSCVAPLADMYVGACSWMLGAPIGLGDEDDAEVDADDEPCDQTRSADAPDKPDLIQERMFCLGAAAHRRPKYAEGLWQPAAPVPPAPRISPLTDDHVSDCQLLHEGLLRRLSLGAYPRDGDTDAVRPTLDDLMPVHVVIVPRLPRDALVEVEALCVPTAHAAARTSDGASSPQTEGAPANLVRHVHGAYEHDAAAGVGSQWSSHAAADGSTVSHWLSLICVPPDRPEDPGLLQALAHRRCCQLLSHSKALLGGQGGLELHKAAVAARATVYVSSAAPAGSADRVAAAIGESLADHGLECATTVVPVSRIPVRLSEAAVSAGTTPQLRTCGIAVHLLMLRSPSAAAPWRISQPKRISPAVQPASLRLRQLR